MATKKTAKSASKKKKRSRGKAPARRSKTTNKRKKSFLGNTFQWLRNDIVRMGLKWSCVAGLWLGILLAAVIIWYAAELPRITESVAFDRRPTIIVKANDGSILHRYGDIKGETVTIYDLPSHLIYAILAVEDRRFYDHVGIDPYGIARAFWVNIKAGGYAQGGSTITQQLAKNLFLSRTRTLKRKIQEALLALWLEHNLTKDEILSAYLNRVYLGSGAYGVDAAARIYFNKPATALTIRESATIAGLLKAPSRYAPSINPTLSAQRTNVVLRSMVDAGFLTEGDIEEVTARAPSPRRKPSSGDSIRYFTDYVVSTLDDLIGTPNKDIIVETTLDPVVQEKAEETITKYLLKYGAKRRIKQGAALFTDLDGAIISMIGGRNYDVSQFNRTVHSQRPPGSSFKPIVYLTALENGWSPEDLVVDQEVEEEQYEKNYQPRNFKDEYFGEVTILEALTRSLNTIAVQLTNDVTPAEVYKTAHRLGIKTEFEPYLSIALGSYGIPMIEMVKVYLTLGRGGLQKDLHAIERITDTKGENIYYERFDNEFSHRAVSPYHIDNLTRMMRSVVENGTGKAAQLPWPAAGKTGTSQDFRDAWFMGFTEEFVGGVWFGNDDNTSMRRVTGGFVPALAWKDIMQVAHQPFEEDYNAIGYSDNTSRDFEKLLKRVVQNDFRLFSDPSPSSAANDNRRRKNLSPLKSKSKRNQWSYND